MKKKWFKYGFLFESHRNVLKKMKLIIVFFFTGLIAVSASTYSQQVKFNLQLKDVSVRKIFEQIEDNSEFILFYNEDYVDVDRRIDIDAKEKKVEYILDAIFEGTNNTYKIYDRQIVILAPGVNEPLFLTKSVKEQPQTKEISGKVTSKDGQPIPGVSVIVKGTTVGTVTDSDGKFQLGIAADVKSLQFSFVGMTTQEVVIGDVSSFDIIMDEESYGLEEVIAVGYGTQKKSDITGSVASINLERLEMVPNLNVAQALQGSIPGLQIKQNTSSASGQSAEIMIRGRNSIAASNSPLVIIDGIPGGLYDVTPNDVKSIEILKDASAAAIYGSRGANGVILITTKEGQLGKPKFSYNAYYSTQRISNLPDIMDAGEFYRMKQVRDAAAIDVYETGVYESGNWTDWSGIALRNGTVQNHNLSVSGATEKVKYYMSVGYQDTEGLTLNDDYQRISSRINLQLSITDWLTIGTRTQLAYEDASGVPVGINNIFNINPLGHAYGPDGELLIWTFDGQSGANPLQVLDFDNTNKDYQISTNNYIDLDIPFIPGLNYLLNTGVRFGYGNNKTYKGTNTASGLSSKGSFSSKTSESIGITLDNIVSYNKSIEKHNITGTFVYSFEKNEGSKDNMVATNYPSDLLKWYATEQAENITPTYSINKTVLISQMFRMNYSYDSRYLLTLTARRDGYSGFGSKTKWGNFPSAAIGWNIANEEFFPLKDVFSVLKLRGSYGLNGNQAIDAYQTIARLNQNNMVSLATSLPGYLPGTLAMDNLGWEASTALNIGLDFGILRNRINGDINLFKTNTTDLLLDRTVSYIHGITSITQNIGETENRGIELSLNSTNISANNFTWKSSGNISYMKNEIVSLYGELDENGQEIDDVASRWFIGLPINSVYNYKWDGVWRSEEADEAAGYGQVPGFVKVEDVDGDGKITSGKDMQIMGQTDPKVMWGLTNSLNYKNFTLNIFMHGVHGVTKRDASKNDHTQAGVVTNNTFKDWWTPENNDANWIANHYLAQLQGGVEIPFFANGSFVRIKDISLAYDLSEKLLKKAKLSKFRIYVTGRNLFTFTEFEGLDPELGNQLATPLQKEYVLGLDISF